eukprot:scaffold11297_cov115-Skeletonema_dohrnii-CCMP3373.AAC.5
MVVCGVALAAGSSYLLCLAPLSPNLCAIFLTMSKMAMGDGDRCSTDPLYHASLLWAAAVYSHRIERGS